MQESESQSEKIKSAPHIESGRFFSFCGLRDKIRKQSKALMDCLKYHYLLTIWKLLRKIRYLKYRFMAYSGLVRRTLIIAVAFLIGQIFIHFIDIFHLSTNQLSTYFVSLGAMAGGIIAIVFTLSIFVQQRAADLYSSQYFEVYTHDWVEKSIYTLIVIITLVFLGFGIFFGSHTQVAPNARLFSIYASFFLVSLIFAFIDFQYERVRKKVNPINAITFLEKQTLKFLDSVHKDAQKIAKIIKAKDKDVSEGIAIASVYNNFLSPYIANLDRQIENLFEISMKLSDRNEINTTNRALWSVCNILSRYLQARKDSSLTFISPINFFAMESDSHNFLSRSFERFNNAGEKFIRSRRIENAVYIVSIYKKLAIQSKEIAFRSINIENPIFDLIKGYLNFYLSYTMREKETEVIFQGIKALGDLSIITIEKNLGASLLTIQEEILKMATFGIVDRKLFLVDECVRNLLRILVSLFQYKFFDAKLAIRKALENIKIVTFSMYNGMKLGYLSSDFETQISLSKAYDEFMPNLSKIMDLLFKLTDERDKSFYKSLLIELFEELNLSLRRLSEEIHDCESLLINSIGRLIFDVNSLIINLLEEDEFKKEYTSELKNRLRWNIHLPYWFVHHTQTFKASNAFDTLTDSVAKTGILLLKKNISDELIVDCIDALYSMVKQCLEKVKGDYSYYDPPRQMKKVVYLGVLSIKYKKQLIFKKIKEQIEEFEAMYKKKYLADLKLPTGIDSEKVMGVPKEDQLFHEVLRWREDFIYEKYNRNGILNRAEELMFDLIDETDIDWFIFEVWNKVLNGSPIEKKIEEKLKDPKNKKRIDEDKQLRKIEFGG